MKLKQSS